MTQIKTWKNIIDAQARLPYYQSIMAFVAEQRAAGKSIFPPQNDVFNAFDSTPFADVKVVILGQDPYHGDGQAHGLSFSVLPEIKIPPSLRNMYKELTTDIDGFIAPDHGYLQSWAEQGVLLLNTVLTVEKSHAHSHAKIGWETFTDEVIAQLNQHREGIVFLLWGNHAQKKGAMIDINKHYVLSAPHPSPLSARRGFFGCQHFSKTNTYLRQKGESEINWLID